MSRLAISWILGLLGAALGGLAGYFLFQYAWSYGYYAPVLSGGMVGVGAGLLGRHQSILRGLLCAIAGIVLGYYCDYRITLLPHFDTFLAYLAAFAKHSTSTNILTILGGLVAYWFGQSNWTEPRRGSAPAKPEEPDPEFP